MVTVTVKFHLTTSFRTILMGIGGKVLVAGPAGVASVGRGQGPAAVLPMLPPLLLGVGE